MKSFYRLIFVVVVCFRVAPWKRIQSSRSKFEINRPIPLPVSTNTHYQHIYVFFSFNTRLHGHRIRVLLNYVLRTKGVRLSWRQIGLIAVGLVIKETNIVVFKESFSPEFIRKTNSSGEEGVRVKLAFYQRNTEGMEWFYQRENSVTGPSCECPDWCL